MLEGLKTRDQPDPMQRSAFRSSWTQPEGVVGAVIVECVIVDINMNIWTVDATSKYDNKQYPNVQISSPYMHYNNGEGIYVMPDIGAKCHICIPSDGPPPFVLDFIMPSETMTNVGDEIEESGQAASEADSDATFAGGRQKPKPGDIFMKGRDGNFVILHKGGVLQIGSTQLAQRIYIPLQNLITDISQNYRHYNSGGSINWFLAQGESKTNPHTILKETYRLRAADEKASIRIAIGELKDFVPETRAQSDVSEFGMGTKDSPIVCEVVLAPDGFGADNGSIDDSTPGLTKLRYFFDRTGNALLRVEGNVVLNVAKTLRIRAEEDIQMFAQRSVTLSAEETMSLIGGDSMQLSAGNVRINEGKNPVGHVGSLVEVFTPVTPFVTLLPIPVTLGPAVVGAVAPGTPIALKVERLNGTVTTGKPNILV
jgi:hypothetical protein